MEYPRGIFIKEGGSMKLNKEEKEHVEEFKKSWEGSPYPPIFVTADALVTCGDKILVIRRGGVLGKGKLAMPGGFVEHNEELIDAAVRELSEETQLNFLDTWSSLDLSACEKVVVDEVGRDPRGRFITHVFHFTVNELNIFELEKTVVGSDDAMEAFWITKKDFLNQYTKDDFFLDHYKIIDYFLSEEEVVNV